MSDDAERFYELHDEIMREARAYEDAAAQPLPASANDDSGTIFLDLSPEGLLTVDIGDNWRDVYAPAELADGVLSVFGALSQARLSEWAVQLDQAMDRPRPSTPVPPTSQTVAGRMKAALEAEPETTAAANKVLENVLDVLDDIVANFDSTYDEAVRRGRAGTSIETADARVRVRVSPAGDLLALEMSPEWLSRATGGDVSRELNEAISRARADTALRATGGMLEGTPLAKYQRFVDDPEAFENFLRGKD
ncbi:hypothetical protein HR12_37745 [Microbacterium sp. SUBG005]|nr:hypothetical protein HR12_37745 [Microbacterium sp. SUBG005]